MTQITMENLGFSYLASPDKYVLQNISLEIEQGQYITFCGPSGSGKSTLLRHLKTVLTPAGKRKGNVTFYGIPLQNVSLREQSAKIGFVMQNPDNQIVTDKVWHELAFGLESLGCENTVIRRRVAEMASYFGIQGWFHKNVNELSGGEKQLLNLASIMVMQPEVLILDEPTSQLDPVAASGFLNTVRKINLDLGITVLISEHRLEEVMPCSDKVAVLEQGRLVEFDEPKAVGTCLWFKKNKMFTALPSAMQIYFQTEKKQNPPLTVREGRQWIQKYVSINSVPKKNRLQNKRKETGKTAVSLQNIWFRYHKKSPDILKGVSFEVEEKSLFALVGGNGTGKSTTLKLIAGLKTPDSGKIYYYGKEKKKQKQDMPVVSMLPQDPLSLFAKGTVKEELEEMSSDRQEMRRLIELMEIGTLLENNPYDVSGGEQQRVALAKVLLTHPKILLLDEPTKGMDTFMKDKLGNALNKFTQQGLTVIMISHDIEFCASYADQVAMFFDGTIISANTAHEFFASNHFYTTAANRLSRDICKDLVTNEEVIGFFAHLRETD